MPTSRLGTLAVPYSPRGGRLAEALTQVQASLGLVTNRWLKAELAGLLTETEAALEKLSLEVMPAVERATAAARVEEEKRADARRVRNDLCAAIVTADGPSNLEVLRSKAQLAEEFIVQARSAEHAQLLIKELDAIEKDVGRAQLLLSIEEDQPEWLRAAQRELAV